MPIERPRKGLRECARLFSPAWFTINMGTGTVCVLAANFHFGYGSTALKIISLIFFFINLSLFVIFTVMSIARFCLYPKLWKEMIFNPAEGLFIGAFPIGSATLIDAMLIANQRWNFCGHAFLFALWAFWWFVLWISYLTAFGMIYALMSSWRHHLIKETTSVWVLPIIPLIVLSATGGSIANALLPIFTTLGTLTTAFSIGSFCIGMSLTLMIISLYLTRLILRGSPPSKVVMASFIIASPLGQGGSSLLVNGENLSHIFPPRLSYNFPFNEQTGQQLYTVCFAGAWVLWAMALCWVLLSLISIYATSRKSKIPFTLSYWGIVFPNGVFALCSVRLGNVLQSPFYHYFGAIWSCIVLALWTLGMILTVYHVWDTSLFEETERQSPMLMTDEGRQPIE